MKIKRFLAPNMREAMRLVRQEQGDDAVILSNRRVEGGIEVVAATDYDAALVQSAAMRGESIEPARLAPSPATAGEGRGGGEPRAEKRPHPAVGLPRSAQRHSEAGPTAPPLSRGKELSESSGEFDALRSEMLGMRKLLEEQLASLAWNDLKTRNPIRADVVRHLNALGIELRLAREIATEIPDGTSAERARVLPLALLSRRIPACKHEWIEGTDGKQNVIALVGATGVGKTTTIAKLAARYVQHWGLRDVALVTTDHFRIGAQEQLFTYGRLLGVPVLTADNQHELCLALDKLRDRKLVLIDTAGMSPRDENLNKQFAMLSGLPVPNRAALVLSACSQSADIDAQVARFAPAAPGAVILTKLDEANRVGPVMSALIRHGLPLAYITDGQRVPEDLAAARPDYLVLRAMRGAQRLLDAGDDDEITLQFSGAAHV